MSTSKNYFFLSLFLCLIGCTPNDDNVRNDILKSLIAEYNDKNETLLLKINKTFGNCQIIEKEPSLMVTYNHIKDSIFSLRRSIVTHLNENNSINKKAFKDYLINLSHNLQNKYKLTYTSNTDSLISLLYLIKEEEKVINNFSSKFGCSICVFGLDTRVLSNKDTLTLSDTLKIAILSDFQQYHKVDYFIENLTLKNDNNIVLPFQTHVLDRETICFFKPTQQGLFKLTGKIKLNGVTGDVFAQKIDKTYIVK
jgi:hypothetical protein